VRDIIRQTCNELGIEIIKGVLSKDHVHKFLAIPPQYSISDVMRRIKGRSS
jgi:putative transposase